MPNLPLTQLVATGVKAPLHGVGPRSGPGSSSFQSTWRTSMGFYVIHGAAGDGSFVTWSELQGTLAMNNAGTLTANNAIDQAIAEVRSWNVANPGSPQQLKCRMGAGIQSPGWATNLDGTASNPSNFTAIQTSPNQPPQQGTCPAFWEPNFRAAWYRFTAALIANYDSVLEFNEIVGGPMMTLYSEPMLRQITGGPTYGLTLVNKGYFAENKGAQRATSPTASYAPDGVLSNVGGLGRLSSASAALVSGDNGSLVIGVGIPYGTTVTSVTSGTASLSNPVTAATSAYVVIMGTGTISDQYLQLDDMLHLVPSAGRTGGWLFTRVGYTYNPYQLFHQDGTNDTDEAFTEIAECFLFSIAGMQASIENNSGRYDYISGTAGAQGGYVAMTNKAGTFGTINGEQTAVIGKMGPGQNAPTLAQFQAVIAGYGANGNVGHIELPANFQTQISDTQITPAQLLALGNALPTASVVSGNPAILQHLTGGTTVAGTTLMVNNAATTAGSTLALHIYSRSTVASGFDSGAHATTFSSTTAVDSTSPTTVSNAWVGLMAKAGVSFGIITSNNTTGTFTLSGGWTGGTPASNTEFVIVPSIAGGTWTNRTTGIANTVSPFGFHATYDIVGSSAVGSNAFTITAISGSIEFEFWELAGSLTYEGGHATPGGTTTVVGSYTTTNATDIVLGSAGWSNGTSTITATPSTPWSVDASVTGVAAAAGSQLSPGFELTTTAGVQTYSGTLSQSSSWVVALTAYKPAGSTRPSVPTSVTAVATGTAGQVTVAWVPGFNGGSVVTSSVITPIVSGVPGTPQTLSGTGTSKTLTGLTAVLTNFIVHQVNTNGAGPDSALPGPAATPASSPVAPAAPTWAGTPGVADGEVDYSWIPGDTGTQPTISFTLTPQSSPDQVTWTTLPAFTINDGPPPSTIYDDTTAINGLFYQASLTATSSAGTSSASALSAIVTPSGPVTPTSIVPAVPTSAGKVLQPSNLLRDIASMNRRLQALEGSAPSSYSVSDDTGQIRHVMGALDILGGSYIGKFGIVVLTASGAILFDQSG